MFRIVDHRQHTEFICGDNLRFNLNWYLNKTTEMDRLPLVGLEAHLRHYGIEVEKL